ncbi:hypothetical protein IscW_ISCW010871 [Ixodes scapularis]|uniref:Uncharacterized protein n=1 Tax=Ixodes scapularis TaxID=6945 RepID=B7Q8J2_IXOSC|nr:hypothetical protein IscW_ISCW010871 [Ixodes scapularis]|eukprot:XP_002405166.1 hypothetical protein IscW_ISCW010871 [Ixodes scapularis]
MLEENWKDGTLRSGGGRAGWLKHPSNGPWLSCELKTGTPAIGVVGVVFELLGLDAPAFCDEEVSTSSEHQAS